MQGIDSGPIGGLKCEICCDPNPALNNENILETAKIVTLKQHDPISLETSSKERRTRCAITQCTSDSDIASERQAQLMPGNAWSHF